MLITGCTYTFRLNAKKDGAVWNLATATVKVLFEQPDGVIVTKTATVTDGANGVAEYTSVAADFTTTLFGKWRRMWEVTDGSTVQRSPWIEFSVDKHVA